MADMYNRDWDEDQISEFERNIELGRVVCDWLLSEDESMECISRAKTKSARNYYVSMLLLAKAQLSLENKGNIP